MKRLILSAGLFLTTGWLWAGALTITAPAAGGAGTPGGSSPQWQYNSGGAFTGVTLSTFNANVTVLSSHTIILASATPSGITVTLPAVSGNNGQIIEVVKADASTQTVTIKAAGSDFIVGSTRTLLLNAIGQTDQLIS